MDWELKQLECVIAFDNRTQTMRYRPTKSSHVTDFNQSHEWIFYSERRFNIKKWYITNEARSAELVMIISYPASPSRIIFFIKYPTTHNYESEEKKLKKGTQL